MSKDEALKLALKALETGWSPTYMGLDARELGMKAITAIKQALEQPQQEPVAWALYQRGRLLSFWLDKGDAYDFEFTPEHQWEPLYTSPPAQEIVCSTGLCHYKPAAQPAPAQEPVGEVNRYGLDSHGRKWHGIYWYDPNVDVAHGTKLYTTPPAAQRQWVGLTDDEFRYFASTFDYGTGGLIRAIEAKLKEKNT